MRHRHPIPLHISLFIWVMPLATRGVRISSRCTQVQGGSSEDRGRSRRLATVRAKKRLVSSGAGPHPEDRRAHWA